MLNFWTYLEVYFSLSVSAMLGWQILCHNGLLEAQRREQHQSSHQTLGWTANELIPKMLQNPFKLL